MSDDALDDPPVARYRLTVEITGNTHGEIEDELHAFARGGYLIHSDYHQRDAFHVLGGRITSKLELRNPDMTAERYETELHDWFERRQAQHRADREREQ